MRFLYVTAKGTKLRVRLPLANARFASLLSKVMYIIKRKFKCLSWIWLLFHLVKWKKCIFHSCLWHSWNIHFSTFFTSLDEIKVIFTPNIWISSIYKRSPSTPGCWDIGLHIAYWHSSSFLTIVIKHTCTQLYCWDRDKNWFDFGDLDPIFSRSQEGSDCWKMACLHPISRMNGRILTKLVHLYCCDREKN